MAGRIDPYDLYTRMIDGRRKMVDALEEAQKQLLDARRGLTDYLSPVSRRMREASTNPQLLEVLIEVGGCDLGGKSRMEQRSHRLEGVELWGDRPAPGADVLRHRLDKFQDEIERSAPETPS
jgi:hypothetical protein